MGYLCLKQAGKGVGWLRNRPSTFPQVRRWKPARRHYEVSVYHGVDGTVADANVQSSAGTDKTSIRTCGRLSISIILLLLRLFFRRRLSENNALNELLPIHSLEHILNHILTESVTNVLLVCRTRFHRLLSTFSLGFVLAQEGGLGLVDSNSGLVLPPAFVRNDVKLVCEDNVLGRAKGLLRRSRARHIDVGAESDFRCDWCCCAYTCTS